MAEWQDNVMAASSAIATATLIPSIVWGPTPTPLTSVPTALCLFATAVSLWTLHLRRSSLTAWCCCALWTALAAQGVYFHGAGG